MTHTILPTVGNPTDFARSFETSNRGATALGVYHQDQTTYSLEVPFLKDRGTFSLSVDAVRDTTYIDVPDTHNILAGELVELANTVTFMQATVLSITAGGGGTNIDRVFLDSLINHNYVVADTAGFNSTDDLLVDGSSTPQVFSVKPGPGQAGDFLVLSFELQSAGTVDFSTFGGGAALTRGVLLRVKHGNGDFRNIGNLKSNGDFIRLTNHFSFLDPKGGNTTNAFSAAIVYGGSEHRGVAIRVDGDLGEELQVVVMDNLTVGNTKFKVNAQGHELQSALGT